jgi:Enoyl-CoA hydratase/isomerase
MVQCCQDVLKAWINDETMTAFLVRSSDAKVPAFCAGGDVKQVYLAGCNTESGPHGQGIIGVPTADFFRDEYIMNYMLATSPIPQISIWDGIVMGTLQWMCRTGVGPFVSSLVVVSRRRSWPLDLREVPCRYRAHCVCHARDGNRYVSDSDLQR